MGFPEFFYTHPLFPLSIFLFQLPQKVQNFQNLKNFIKSFATEIKLLGRVGFYIEIFFPKSENDFKCDFSRAKVRDFSNGDREAKTSQTLTLEKSASKLFSNFGKKICKTKSVLPNNISLLRSCFSHALKSVRSLRADKM